MRVWFDETAITLTALEFEILAAFLARPEMVFSREQIMEAAYGAGTYVSDRTIDSHIRNLRAKFADAGCSVDRRDGARGRLSSSGPQLMAAPRVPQKWRPTLAMIVFAVLLTVLALPAAIVVWFRYLEHTSEMRPIELGALGVALVLTVVIAVVFSRTITGPINALVERTEEIGRGGRAAIIAPEQLGTREIATLSQSFLDLAERLVDRNEYVSSFAAHVSHELKSPVTAIRGSAELLRDAEMSKEERKRFLDHIIADSDRLTALLERLRELARADLDVARWHHHGGGGGAR